MTKRQRTQVHSKYGSRCAYCGELVVYSMFQVDHIIPQSLFFAFVKNKFQVPAFLKHLNIEDVDHIDNLNPACRKCNGFKSSFHLEFFRSELQSQLERAKKYSTNYRFALKYNQVKETPQPIVFYFEKDLPRKNK